MFIARVAATIDYKLRVLYQRCIPEDTLTEYIMIDM